MPLNPYRKLPNTSISCKPELGEYTSPQFGIQKKRAHRAIYLSSSDYCRLVSFFESEQENDEELNFFTKYELMGYDYMQPLDLTAYIAVEPKESPKDANEVAIRKTKGKKIREKTSRYFLHLFDPQTPSFVYRNTVTNYSKYYDDYIWQEATENEPFPMVLFVCHDEKAKNHIKYYAKAKFEKEYEEKFSLYVTTIKTILSGGDAIWEKVEID